MHPEFPHSHSCNYLVWVFDGVLFNLHRGRGFHAPSAGAYMGRAGCDFSRFNLTKHLTSRRLRFGINRFCLCLTWPSVLNPSGTVQNCLHSRRPRRLSEAISARGNVCVWHADLLPSINKQVLNLVQGISLRVGWDWHFWLLASCIQIFIILPSGRLECPGMLTVCEVASLKKFGSKLNALDICKNY